MLAFSVATLCHSSAGTVPCSPGSAGAAVLGLPDSPASRQRDSAARIQVWWRFRIGNPPLLSVLVLRQRAGRGRRPRFRQHEVAQVGAELSLDGAHRLAVDHLEGGVQRLRRYLAEDLQEL